MENYKQYIDKSDFYEADYGQKIYGSLIGKFKIGDTVKIIVEGETYDKYDRMFLSMNLKEMWLDGVCGSVLHNEIGTIVGRKLHEDFTDILYGVKLHKNEGVIIIGETGLKLMTSFAPLDNSLFEI